MSSAKRGAARQKGGSITTLYQDFERAVAFYNAMPKDKDGPKFDRAVDRAARIAEKIAVQPAASVAEMLLKIRVAAWDIGDMRYEHLEDLDGWKPTRFSPGLEHQVLASLRADLSHVVFVAGGR